MGLDVTNPAEHAFAIRWDPRPDAEVCDHDWIGEDSEGVWCKLNPLAALSREPDLAAVAFEARARSLTELPAGDFERLSSWQWQAFSTAVDAINREIRRREKAGHE